jgi:ornithine cyclodeaminase
MPAVMQLDQIKELVDIPQLIEDIEAGFVLYSQGRVQVPPVGFLHFDDPPGDVHIKYGSVTDGEFYVMKMASAFPNNVALGVPVGNGVILVFSRKTGALDLVLMDEGWLTDIRTAAAGAVAARHLAPSKVNHIGIVGTGVQAALQLELLQHVVDCGSCIIWGRNSTNVRDLIERLQAKPHFRKWGLEFQEAPDMDSLTSQCELIVTATPARAPLIRANQVRPGTHITAVGSDDHGKQELEAALLGRADVIVADSIAQCVDHGECFHAVQDGSLDEGAIRELGTVIEDPTLGRVDDQQITVADSTGVAIQDIQIATMVNRAFLEKQTS